MKKIIKHKSSTVAPDAESDLALQINRVQQQLVILEQKMDTLLSQSSERPSEERRFVKPFQRFDRHYHHDKEGRDDHRRERSFTQAICADCNKECEVPFKPSGDRPVYCKECFSKRKGGGSFKAKYDDRPREEVFTQERNFDKQHGSGSHRQVRRSRPSFRRRKDRV
jgi:CxxC-x17-CxxC domain-containing protein